MPRRKNWPALLLAAPLLAYVAYPLGAMLAESLTLPVARFRVESMGWDPEHQPFAAPLRRVLVEPNTRAALWGTAKISLLTALTSTLWGLGLALLWWRREFPGRRFFAALGYAPILMPPLAGTLAFFRLAGKGGLLWAGVPFLDSAEPASGFTQVLIMHTYAFGIYSYAYIAAALEDAETSREEAARNLGAGRWRTFTAATWPAIRPALLASTLLIFMAAAASFSAPYILDNESRYLTVEIMNYEADPGMRSALSVLLAAFSLCALPAFLYVGGYGKAGAEVELGTKGADRRGLTPAAPAARTVRFGLSILAALVLLAPPFMVVVGAFSADVDASGAARGVFTSLDSADARALGRSCAYGAAAAAVDLALAVAIALGLRRASFYAALPVEFAVMLTLALPGSAVAVALLTAFNGPSLLTAGVPLGHTAAILIMAYAVRNLPLAVRPIRAALTSVGGDIEHAAASLGATRGRFLRRLTLPLLFPPLLAAALICFITGAGEYVASKILFGFNTQPVSVRIDEVFRNEKQHAYALALCLMLLSVAAIGAAAWLQRRAAK